MVLDAFDVGFIISCGSNLFRSSLMLLMGNIRRRMLTTRMVSMRRLSTDGGNVPGLRLRLSKRGARKRSRALRLRRKLRRLVSVALMVQSSVLDLESGEYGALAVLVVGHYRDAGGL